MSVSLPDFWQLVEKSGLLEKQQIQRLKQDFAQVKGADQSNAKVLVEWLVANNVLSRYQTTILAAGRSGPFFYGDYRVYDRIGSGPLSGMFRATHSTTGHPVLLQFLTGPDSEDPQRWLAIARRVLKESSYVHRHLHRCFEPVDLGNFKFLVFDDLRGKSLAQRLEDGRLAPAEAAHTVRLAALGLLFLHQNREVHGDVRPANLWMFDQGNVQVMRSPARNLDGPVIERVDNQQANYLAPEFLDPAKRPDVQTDIYALGCVLYEALAGHPPFDGGDVTQKMQRHAGEAIAPLEPHGVPAALAQTVAYLMAKNPEVRFRELAPVVEQLRKAIDGPLQSWQPPSPPATLSAYEARIREKHAKLKQQMASTPAASSPNSFPSPADSATGAAATPAIQVAPSGATPVVAAASGDSKLGRRGSSGPSKQKTRNLAIGLGATGALLIALILALNFMGGGDPDNDRPDPHEVAQNDNDRDGTGGPSVTPTSRTNEEDTGEDNGNATTDSNGSEGSAAGSESDAALQQQIMDDNGKLLWASPTSGPRLELDYLPLASLAFISTRPADMLATEEGPRVLNAMGPHFQSLLEGWESAAGVKLQDIEQLLIGLHDVGDEFPRPSFVVRLAAPISADELKKRWNNPEEAVADGRTVLLGEKWAYYLPADAPNVFVMGHADEVQDVAMRKGAPPPTRSGMSSLFDKTDANRHFNLVFVPHDVGATFFRDGRQLFFGDPAKLREPLDWFLGDALKAVLFSAHFDENFYMEIRITSELGREEETVATELRDRLEQIPERVETYMAERINPSVYWRRVAMKYPGIIRFLHSNTRVQVEDGHAVINAVMPDVAAHNLVFGSEMTLVAQPGAAVVVTEETPKGPQSLEELLATKSTIMFDQTSLEFAAKDIETDVKDANRQLPFPFAIKIIGDDLKLNGITRNQQIRDFSQNDQTIADILTALVMKANPVTTVKEPSEADQKLLWVLGPDPDKPDDTVVLITTREAAEKKQYTLPKPFQLKE